MGIVGRVMRQYRKHGLAGVLGATGRSVARLARLAFDLGFVLLTSEFFKPATGRGYGIGFLQKVGIALRFARNSRHIRAASDWKEHLLMATEILKLPPQLEGAVVECGAFCGFSTANLSIACKLCGRRLYVCDSFEGLPKPKEDEGLTIIPQRREHYDFHEGQYEGALDLVQHNVARFGEPEVCTFIKGYFEQTLPGLDVKAVLVFEDADLKSSVETCLKHLWPRLQPGCAFYCHEPWSAQIVELFYSRQFWREALDAEPPGFFGSGFGIPLGPAKGSGIGFARKIDLQDYLSHSTLRKGM